MAQHPVTTGNGFAGIRRKWGALIESEMEIWKDIPGYEGRYRVSDLGRVKGPRGFLRPPRLNSGYLAVSLWADGSKKTWPVHRLVALVFVPGHFAGAHVNHKDCDKSRNVPANLEWVTRSENMRHSYAHGHPGPRRFAVRGTSLTDDRVVEFPSQLAAERALTGRASSAINHCLCGRKKSAYGFRWERA